MFHIYIFFFCTFQIVVSGVCVPLRSGLCGVKFEVLCLSRGMHGEHQRADQKHTGSFQQSVTCPFFNKLFSVTWVLCCHFFFQPSMSVKRLQKGEPVVPHTGSNTLHKRAWRPKVVHMCESACGAQWLRWALPFECAWLIVKSSHRVHTEHTLLKRSNCALCCIT